MMKVRHFIFSILFSISMIAPGNSQSVVDIVVNSPDHNTLETAVIAADLATTLSGTGPFTLFAPTDDAFAALPAGTIDALLADPSGALTDILLYHAVSGDVRSTDLVDGTTAMTINGADVNITINMNGVFINDAQVTMADVAADNGVVHVIDAVLIPPTPSNTVVDIVVNSPDHNTLEAAVIAADLATTLSGTGPFTLFAPTDDAFAALPAGTIDALLADPSGALTDILLYHAVSGDVRSTDLVDGTTAMTVNGADVNITINMNGVFINDAQVTVADLVADNGVVHVIDAVLIPPTPSNTVVDIVVNSPDHNTLEAAVIAADLATTLSGTGPFTLFAPTDDAFAALPAGTIDALLADPSGALTDILLYHAVSGDVRSTDLVDGTTAMTVNGADVNITVNMDGVFINDAQVTVADLVADNGVVHVIDAVLIPPTPSNTVVDIVVNSPDHNTLEAAVIAADLATTLSGTGPFTLFAPTDDAFAALPAGTIDALLADPSGALTDILLYHAVSGDVRSTDLVDGTTAMTVNGADVNITVNMDGVFINDAQVTVADLVADNGVVHVIDAVLIPPVNTNSIMDIIANSPVHNTLETAVTVAELNTTLDVGGPFTVFAPTDAAFEALGSDLVNSLLADPQGLLQAVLLQHVVSGVALSSDLSNGQEITTLLGESVVVTINNDGIFIDNAQVTLADLEADNGVVHVIDAVLLPPPPTVVDVIVGSPLHNTLETAVTLAGLVPTLQGPGPFTVFAPTDDAFAALPDGVLDALIADPSGDLTDILLYHVLSADVRSTDLTDGQMAMTINGKDINVSINNDGVFINDAQVVLADIVTGNGVVHIIDAVLIPPTQTVVDIIVNSPDHETLEAAVVAAGLVETLNGDGPFTVFAPTDAAFGALPAGTIDALLADPTGDLTDILLYHVLGADVRSTDLTDGQTAATLFGQNITVTINTDGVFINDAQVTAADIATDNGVVHVIDAVLIPTISSNENIDNLASISIYPNPATDYIDLEFKDLDTENMLMNIVSSEGKLAMSQRINNSISRVDVSNLENGIYILELIDKVNKYYKKLVIK